MNGQWVSCGACEAPWIMGSFHVQDASAAAINICGLGFFELYLNGDKVSPDVLTPVWSDYSSREGQYLKYPLHDTMHTRVYYCRYDVLPFLKAGDNDLAVLLGGGWFNQRMRQAEGEMWYGDHPKLWFELTWTDEQGQTHCYASGEELRWRPSHIVHSNVYFGETQDLRVKDTEPRPVEIVPAPDGEMTLQECPADRVIREIRPVYLGEVGGRRVYDAGENITGWVKLTVAGPEDSEVTVRHAEELHQDGSLDFFFTGGEEQIQQAKYISDGKAAVCAPHFTWMGFRYFDIEGCAEDVTVQVVHSDVPVKGSFACSDKTINWLVDAYLRSRLGNMHCGVPSDCPHRERLGYTGDGQATIAADMLLLEGDAFYRKWLRDIADSQCAVTGHVQHTAPFYGGGGGPGGWGGAIVFAPWAHYGRYRDKALLADFFPRMLRWVDYMTNRMDERGLVVREEEGGWCLGDWCTPGKVIIPEPYVNTCLLARALGIMIEAAEILGEPADALSALLDKTRAAIHHVYYNEETGRYADGIQGADAYALEAGLGGEALADLMARHYDGEPGFDTGFIGTAAVIRQLFAYGYGDTALHLLMSHAPERSFGWEMDHGATTLWERWNGRESHNHPMFGGCVEGLLTGLMGVQAGAELVIAPSPSRLLDWAQTTVQTCFGQVSVRWEHQKDVLQLTLSLPCEAALRLFGREERLPAGDHTLSVPMPEEI